MRIERIYVGGWFQRTTLHLSEIYDFLKEANSPLDLDQKKLTTLRDDLLIDSVELKVDNLEYIVLESSISIEIKIFEDGLIVLSKLPDKELSKSVFDLTSYYEKKLSPAISYIFSLGAPIPKELANIKTIYPYFVVLNKAKVKDIKHLLEEFSQEKYFEVRKKSFEVYRGNKLYLINNLSEKFSDIEKFIQEQIFIREFKGQLHRYLNLHRIIWEKIADVKEKGKIRGSEVGKFNDKIESYAKTINLIDARINQMGSYISTRASVLKSDPAMEKFSDVLQFKHETLADTLSYIKDIWGMTGNYVNSALDLFSSIQAKSTEASVTNLTIITSMGVGATLIGLFAQDAPEIQLSGVVYFIILAVIGYSANKIMRVIARKRTYRIQDTGNCQGYKIMDILVPLKGRLWNRFLYEIIGIYRVLRSHPGSKSVLK